MKPLAARLAAYEVFLPLVAVAAVVAILLSRFAFSGAWTPPGGLAPHLWHAHELLFGHFPAAFGGVMLTAIPRWTGRPALAPAPLLALAALWIAGRAALLFAGTDPAPLFVAPLFPLALALAAARPILAARDTRNLGFPALLVAFAGGETLFLLGETDLGLRLGLAAAALAAVVMGGRVAPALTRHLAQSRGTTPAPPLTEPLDRAAVALAGLALAAWAAAPTHTATLALLAAASLAHAARLTAWHGATAWDRPPFLALHLGYAGLPLAFALLAAHGSTGDPRLADAGIHALGVAVFGLMCAAVLASVLRRYAGLALAVDRLADTTVAALTLATLARLAAALHPSAMLLDAAILAWAVGWATFLALTLARPRRRTAPEAIPPAS